MLRRILEIAIFPFQLFHLIITFPLKVIKLILTDRKEQSTKKRSFPVNQVELLEAGKLLFPLHTAEFQEFFGAFINDKNRFLAEEKTRLENYHNFELNSLRAIEVIYIFGDSRELLWTTDWRGEENEGEIENFLVNKLKIKATWTHVSKFRDEADQEDQNDGKYILGLLKAVDKDLVSKHKRLIFLDLGWDAYVYTVVTQTSFKKIIDSFGSLAYGTEHLTK